MRQLLTERYRERLAGVLSCYDRIIVTGTLPGACYAKGMMGFLSARQIRVFDYPRFAEPLRDRVRDRAAELASAAGVTIEHIAKKHIRKEDVVAKILAVRGDHPGLVHIISAMEAARPPPLAFQCSRCAAKRRADASRNPCDQDQFLAIGRRRPGEIAVFGLDRETTEVEQIM